MSKKRGFLVWGLVVLATLVTLVSTLTIWSKRQLLNSDSWANSSARLLADDQIRGRVSQTLVDRLFQRIDVEAILAERLPPRLQSAAPVFAASLQGAATRAADNLLTTPKVQALWKEINYRAHKALVNVLRGNDIGPNGNVSTAGGVVTLDLRPLINRLATKLGLEERLKANASPDSGQIVIMKSSQLQSAQDAVQTFDTLSIFMVIAVFVLYGLAIYLARGRRRVFLEVIGASLILVALVIAIVRRVVGDAVIDSLIKVKANQPPANTIWLVMTDVMRDIAIALIIYGALAILAGALAGPSRPAVAIRRWLAPTFRDRPVIVYVVALGAFMIWIAWGPFSGSRQLWGTLALAALVALGIEVWRRQTIREFPAAPPASAARPKPPEGGAAPGTT